MRQGVKALALRVGLCQLWANASDSEHDMAPRSQVTFNVANLLEGPLHFLPEALPKSDPMADMRTNKHMANCGNDQPAKCLAATKSSVLLSPAKAQELLHSIERQNVFLPLHAGHQELPEEGHLPKEARTVTCVAGAALWPSCRRSQAR